MSDTRILAYAQLNAKIYPMSRGEWFEDPLHDALVESGFGEVGGGGTLQKKSGEIEYCGIDVDLFDLANGAPFVCEFLASRGAPKGSKLTYRHEDQNVEIPFGSTEGIAVYMNGTDLPDEIYKTCDINFVIETIEQLLKGQLKFQSTWQGPTETALYFYGKSAQQMQQSIAGFIADYPLCQRARIETIAS